MTNCKIQLFAEEVCRLLKIDVPRIEVAPQKLISNTQLAALCEDLLILKDSLLTPDTAFAISHELRHRWQIVTDGKTYFNGYKEVGALSVEDYNLQLAEIDANAFAMIVMSNFFGIKPTFDGLSNNIKLKISARAKVIMQDVTYSPT